METSKAKEHIYSTITMVWEESFAKVVDLYIDIICSSPLRIVDIN